MLTLKVWTHSLIAVSDWRLIRSRSDTRALVPLSLIRTELEEATGTLGSLLFCECQCICSGDLTHIRAVISLQMIPREAPPQTVDGKLLWCFAGASCPHFSFLQCCVVMFFCTNASWLRLVDSWAHFSWEILYIDTISSWLDYLLQFNYNCTPQCRY